MTTEEWNMVMSIAIDRTPWHVIIVEDIQWNFVFEDCIKTAVDGARDVYKDMYELDPHDNNLPIMCQLLDPDEGAQAAPRQRPGSAQAAPRQRPARTRRASSS
jgi:hypothetical protein